MFATILIALFCAAIGAYIRHEARENRRPWLVTAALAVLFLCKIGRQDAAGRAQFCGQRFQPVGAAGGQDEPAAQLCIAACKLLPDAGACASDPDGLLHGDFPFSSRPQSGGFLYLLPLF